jgi:AraC-like DNA-binding protein
MVFGQADKAIFEEELTGTNTFLASFGMIGLRVVETFGFNSYRFAKRLGVPTKATYNLDMRLPGSMLDAGFKNAMEMIADPAFALRAAECWHPSHFKALGYAWLASGSLYTALSRLERFICISAGQALLSCSDTDEGLCLTYNNGRGKNPLGHTMADFDLSLIVSMCRANIGGSIQLRSVTLQRPIPLDREPYDNFFQCDVTFGAEQDRFVLPWKVVNKPLATANAEFAQIFDDILVGELERISGADLVHRSRRFLIENISAGEPSEERLAEAMAMSRRTLQRKLAERGLTYRTILDNIRHDMALKYLGSPDKSLTEIAFLLGFSEQSAFARAFRRWQGVSPSAYRNVD